MISVTITGALCQRTPLKSGSGYADANSMEDNLDGREPSPSTQLDAGGAPPAVDQRVFAALMDEVGGGDDDIREILIDTYVSDARRRIGALGEAVAVADAKAAAAAAHGLRSSSALMGALPLAASLQRCETMAKIGPVGLPDILEEIEILFQSLTSDLDQMRMSATTANSV